MSNTHTARANPSREELIEAVESQNIRIHDLEVQLRNNLSQTPVIMDTKVEGVSMPKFHGKPQESVDMYFFQQSCF